MTIIKHRRGTSAQWAASPRKLADGEIGIDEDTDEFRLGNGSALWDSLKKFITKEEQDTVYMSITTYDKGELS